MKRKGFTLIEMIVVIAIIGVLAALLIPAMAGYVAKAKIQNANAAAREVLTGVNLAMSEMMNQDYNLSFMNGTISTTGAAVQQAASQPVPAGHTTDVDELSTILYHKAENYFSDIVRVDTMTMSINDGHCSATGVMLNNYPGSHPIAIGSDNYNAELRNGNTWDSNLALTYALGRGQSQEQQGG